MSCWKERRHVSNKETLVVETRTVSEVQRALTPNVLLSSPSFPLILSLTIKVLISPKRVSSEPCARPKTIRKQVRAGRAECILTFPGREKEAVRS